MIWIPKVIIGAVWLYRKSKSFSIYSRCDAATCLFPQHNIIFKYIIDLCCPYKGCHAAPDLARTYQSRIPYPKTWLSLWLISLKCSTLVRCLTIWECLAKLWGTIQDHMQIDYSLALILQRLPGSGRPCKDPKNVNDLALPGKGPRAAGYPYISYLPMARICHFSWWYSRCNVISQSLTLRSSSHFKHQAPEGLNSDCTIIVGPVPDVQLMPKRNSASKSQSYSALSSMFSSCRTTNNAR